MLQRIRNTIDNEFHIVFENKMSKYHANSDDIFNKIRDFLPSKDQTIPIVIGLVALFQGGKGVIVDNRSIHNTSIQLISA